jgi:hypothetical protein
MTDAPTPMDLLRAAEEAIKRLSRQGTLRAASDTIDRLCAGDTLRKAAAAEAIDIIAANDTLREASDAIDGLFNSNALRTAANAFESIAGINTSSHDPQPAQFVSSGRYQSRPLPDRSGWHGVYDTQHTPSPIAMAPTRLIADVYARVMNYAYTVGFEDAKQQIKRRLR